MNATACTLDPNALHEQLQRYRRAVRRVSVGDRVVLPDRPGDAELMARDVSGERSVGQVKPFDASVMGDGREFGGWYDGEPHPP